MEAMRQRATPPLIAFAFASFCLCLSLLCLLPLPLRSFAFASRQKQSQEALGSLPQAFAFAALPRGKDPKAKAWGNGFLCFLPLRFGSDANARAMSNGIRCLRPNGWPLGITFALRQWMQRQWEPIGFAFASRQRPKRKAVRT